MAKSEWDGLIVPLHHLGEHYFHPPDFCMGPQAASVVPQHPLHDGAPSHPSNGVVSNTIHSNIQFVEVQDKPLHRLWSELTRIS